MFAVLGFQVADEPREHFCDLFVLFGNSQPLWLGHVFPISCDHELGPQFPCGTACPVEILREMTISGLLEPLRN